MLGLWTTSWAVRFPSIVHVLPNCDLMEHRPSQHCQCNPRKDFNQMGIHTTGVIWVHHAHDGRN